MDLDQQLAALQVQTGVKAKEDAVNTFGFALCLMLSVCAALYWGTDDLVVPLPIIFCGGVTTLCVIIRFFTHWISCREERGPTI